MVTSNKIIDRATTLRLVHKVLHEFCVGEINKARACDPSYERLWLTIDEYLAHGGKRLRPYLVLLSYEAYGGKNTRDILPVACAWELLHAGMLVHDDIIDRDYVRHGHRNISGVYKELYESVLGVEADHYAAGAALMAGDLLLSSAQQIIMHSILPDKDKLAACSYVQDALFYVAGGELMDVETILYNLDDVHAEKVAKYKTARYSFELPLVSGAALAGAPQRELTLLRSLGENIGIAFQLVDDMLGVFGEPDETGKSNNGDIREKKRTLLIQETMQRIVPKQARRLNELFNNRHTITDLEIDEVRLLIKLSGAKEAVAAKVALYSDQALAIVDELHVQPVYANELRRLIEALIVRVK